MRIILVIISIGLVLGNFAFALPKYLNTFKENYPHTVKTKLDSCSICHPKPDKKKELNSFGQGFKTAKYSYSVIEVLDSDGDRFTNFEEIAAETLPGDNADKPDIPALIKQIKELKQKVEELEAKLKSKE